MHPVIATVVAECFYPAPGQLVTTSTAAQEFAAGQEPFVFADDRLPASPVVLVDMPYVQRAAGAGDELPIYHNPAERDAVMAILSSLKPRSPQGNPPTLAILSPYDQQVKRLRLAVEDGIAGPLATPIRSPVRSGERVGTVNSFQGSEADIVVISLVRNNDHTGRRALGFLERPAPHECPFEPRAMEACHCREP